MTQPRPLGTTAKTVLESVEKLLDANTDAFFGVVLATVTDEDRKAIQLLGDAAARNNVALRVLVLLRADRLPEAQDALIDLKLTKGTHK